MQFPTSHWRPKTLSGLFNLNILIFQAVVIPKDREEEKKEKFKINQFNLVASEMISLNRSLADVRLPA